LGVLLGRERRPVRRPRHAGARAAAGRRGREAMIEAAVLAGAFAAGLAGSGHCLAMCGGIAAALARAPTRRASLANAGLNALGRATSYALAGALAATVAGTLGLLLEAATLRTAAAWASALALLAIGLKLTGICEWRALERIGARAWVRLAPATRALARLPRGVRPFAA